MTAIRTASAPQDRDATLPLSAPSGYTAEGEDFGHGSGIPHRTMVKALV